MLQSPPTDLVDAHVTQLAIGLGDHSCIVDQFAQVRCWGTNDFGQLGIASTQTIGDDEPAGASPALLERDAAHVAVGERHTCYVDDMASVRCWGAADTGQLGNGSTKNIGDNEPVPTGVVVLGGAARKVVAGKGFSCALLSDSTVWCWGDGTSGQLASPGVGALGDNELPVESPRFRAVKLLDEATDIDAGADHACARTADARLRCWGSGAHGRLGYGNTDNVGDREDTLPVGTVPVFQAF